MSASPLVLPPGVFTLLPLVNVTHNFTLPSGPWSDAACRARLPEPAQSSYNDSSAIDDSDDEADSGENDEFLVPLFVELPHSSAYPPQHSRTSRSNSRTSSFSRRTPLPTLRSSSPTPSHPTTAPPSKKSAKKAPSQPIGFLRPSIVEALKKDNRVMAEMGCKPVWEFRPPIELPSKPPSRRSSFGSRRGSSTAAAGMAPLTPASATPTASESAVPISEALSKLSIKRTYAVGFSSWINEGEEGDPHDVRKEHLDRIARGWKMTGQFADQLDGWRDELYPVYGPAPPFSGNPVDGTNDDDDAGHVFPGSNRVFELERAACALLGIATFGVHLTAYIEEPGEPLKVWVPKRSATKQTWPSYYDNTVAGGITSGQSPWEAVIRECEEEASLPADFVEPRVKSTGVLSYTYRTKEGWVQPEVQYCYDLKMQKGDPTPIPNDGEVEAFKLLTIDEVVQIMLEGKMKPNCCLVLLDFLVRHGYLTSESDTRYLEIVTRLRGTGPVLPGPA
ncbi:thiamine pyrophosphokinase-related protein [Pseudohyphozyma bogoriensis]|nr:thiamine pyrophosphokinase-related protein [Pseudohyphozyma bogoriensis]